MSDPGDTPESFNELVDGWLKHAVAGGAEHFEHILTALPGVYPAVVIDSIRRLSSRGELPDNLLAGSEAFIAAPSAQSNNGGAAPHRVVLPVPHPLDYEWRFDDESAGRLISEASRHLGADDTVAMIGTPSVFRAGVESPAACRHVILDRNPVVINCLQGHAPNGSIVRCDVTRDEVPDLRAAAVVVDPPWYEEYMRAFAWAACRVALPGARIYFSLPPVGTRPGVGHEVNAFFEWSRLELGLELASFERGALPYETPPFERNALRAAGFFNVPPAWRRGDLAVFTRPQKAVPARPPSTYVQCDDGDWAEESIDGVRFRLRFGGRVDEEIPALLSIVEGDVLPTVSRRDERRRKVDIWTSGNRVFACRGRRLLRCVLRALASNTPPVDEINSRLNRKLTESEAESVRDTAAKILEVVNAESAEYSYA
jgi:hypothetical protein